MADFRSRIVGRDIVLTLTPAATNVVSIMAETSDKPDTSGLRISSTGDAPQAVELEVEFVAAPADEDQVLTQEGARVYLESEVADFLADKVLDADTDDDGHVHFALGQQVDGGPAQL